MSKLFVRGLAWGTDDRSLNTAFSQYGELVEAKVCMERDDPRKSRGFGFVTFKSEEHAARALEMNDREVDGRRIQVSMDGDKGKGKGGSDRYDGGDRYGSGGGGGDRYGNGGSSQAPAKVEDTNNKIYITGLPPNVKAEELQEKFGMIGVVARKKQKRGYPDQWPFKINIYTGSDGKCKGDASLTYEDPNAAQSASGFFTGSELDNHPGFTLTVQMADVKEEAPREEYGGGGGGSYGGGKGKGKGRSGDRGYGGREGGGSRGDYRSEPYGRR
mmetsp:Transcript_32264/g.41465  ORF Transcript_32264/g.41465 Transcript_32264/m.41465 type:complete len:272 (-) Transcript_32264:217-1032(-)